MNIKEQICAEIKAQKSYAERSYVPGDDNNYWYGKVVLCDDLLAFLDSIPEQPASEGLEDEIANYYGNIPDDDDKVEAASHFAEWQKAKMMEEAAEKYVHELYTDEEGYHCYISLGTEYAPGDKVRVIVINEDEK